MHLNYWFSRTTPRYEQHYEVLQVELDFPQEVDQELGHKTYSSFVQLLGEFPFPYTVHRHRVLYSLNPYDPRMLLLTLVLEHNAAQRSHVQFGQGTSESVVECLSQILREFHSEKGATSEGEPLGRGHKSS